jgi:glycosyltransferase involved in cell wall biosynthesis
MYDGHSVGVVVPAYNEEDDIGRVIDTIPPYVDRVYVIDDGSTDDTWAQIQLHAARRNRDGPEAPTAFDEVVVPIRHERNRGVGGAIKTGYEAALEDGIDVTAVMGGDGQMASEVPPRYLAPIIQGTADYTKGNRFLRPDDLAVMPRFRFVGNVLLSVLTRVASGYWGLADSQNGYTAISRSALERIDLDGMYEYYGYCNDLLVRLNVIDARVVDVETSSRDVYEGGWDSHIRYTEYVPRVSWMLLRRFLWRLWHKHLRADRHPLAVAYVIGLLLLAAGSAGLIVGFLEGGSQTAAFGLIAGIAGSALFFFGSVLDRARNRPLNGAITQEPEPTDTGAEPLPIASQ